VTKIHKTGDGAADAANKVAYFEGLKTAPMGAVLIKAADRLHNLRSLASCSAAKQQAQFKETTEVLLPLFEAALNRGESRFEELDRLVQLARVENELLGARL
jgi:(p)ppGpp synthase/HD superfamily hydrolase